MNGNAGGFVPLIAFGIAKWEGKAPKRRNRWLSLQQWREAGLLLYFDRKKFLCGRARLLEARFGMIESRLTLAGGIIIVRLC